MSSGKNHTLQHCSDDELLTLYRSKGDLDILGELYKRYMVLVYGVCMKYLRNRDDSQDAVMQIFETLLRDIPRFEIRNFKSWLYGVSRNHCLMKLRKDVAERNRHDKISAEFFMESTLVQHPIEETENAALQEQLSICMEQLRTAQRRCIELFYYQHLCYKEIAAMLKVDENKVKSHIQNGKRNLKICIESNVIANHAGN